MLLASVVSIFDKWCRIEENFQQKYKQMPNKYISRSIIMYVRIYIQACYSYFSSTCTVTSLYHPKELSFLLQTTRVEITNFPCISHNIVLMLSLAIFKLKEDRLSSSRNYRIQNYYLFG